MNFSEYIMNFLPPMNLAKRFLKVGAVTTCSGSPLQGEITLRLAEKKFLQISLLHDRDFPRPIRPLPNLKTSKTFLNSEYPNVSGSKVNPKSITDCFLSLSVCCFHAGGKCE